MASDELCWMTAADLAAAIVRKKVSPVEVVDAVLGRIEKTKALNAYVTVDASRSRARGRSIARPRQGRMRAL